MTHELSHADVVEAHRALDELLERRHELRRACEGAVVQWQWATEASHLHRPEPLFRERYGLRAPRLLDGPPPSPSDEQQYGLDACGDIVVAREYVGPRSFREELRVRRGDTVVGFRWMETGEPAEVNLARFAAGTGQLQSYVTVWPQIAPAQDVPHGSMLERYEWDGDRVSTIHTEMLLAFDDVPPEPESMQLRASYDSAGRLVELREHGARREKVLYRAGGTTPSTAQRHRVVEERLVELLPRLVAEHVSEPIYCVALHYHPEWPLPPNIAVGSARERREWTQEIADAETLRYTVWNPAEFDSYTGESLGGRPLRDLDPDLAAALDEIPDDSPNAHERARTTLNRAAHRLQKLDWRSVAAVTDDFVVFAVDLELSHLDENLRYSVPAVLRKQLADRGLL